MSIYQPKGSKVYWYEFQFCGRRIRESSKTRTWSRAEAAMEARRRELENAYNRIPERKSMKTFAEAARAFLEKKKGNISESTLEMREKELDHLQRFFGKMFLNEITDVQVKKYQALRLSEITRYKTAFKPRTVNMEVGTLRSIMLRNGMMENIRDAKMLPDSNEEIGRALSEVEIERLSDACANSQSVSMNAAFNLALCTGLRYSDIRLLKWENIDLERAVVVVGKSKTKNSSGRRVLLNSRASETLRSWLKFLPPRSSDDYIFPSHRVSKKRDGTLVIHHLDWTKPMGSWKVAWTLARKKAKVWLRFHDLRHTAVTFMLEGGTPLDTAAAILGWSAATRALMAKRYMHLCEPRHRQAVALLEFQPTAANTEVKKDRKKQTRKRSQSVSSNQSTDEKTKDPAA